MDNSIKKIAIMTGGGDAPGLNAVVRAAALTAIKKYGLEVVGIKNGYRGLFLGESQMIPLTEENVAGIIGKGGTVLYNSNKDNLFKYPRRNKDGFVRDENGNIIYEDLSNVAVENLKKAGIDALVIVGGDGTLTSGRDYSRMGVKVIGVPKTIDNDLNSTDVTFGFDTAVCRSTEAIECLRTTGEAHHRIMVLEVMGRSAGHLALHSGIAGAADVILIPEIPYDIEKVCEAVKRNTENGKYYTIVAVSEGAKPKDGEIFVRKIVSNSPDSIRLGGISNKIAEEIEERLDIETRATVLGHIQRGGQTSPYDRVLSTRYGVKAMELAMEGTFGVMVALIDGKVTYSTLEDAVGRLKTVPADSEMVQVARTLGISFGD